MQLKNTLPMLMLAALASLAAVPVVHAFGGVIADEASSHTRALLSHTDGELASPYTTADAVVLGEAGPEVTSKPPEEPPEKEGVQPRELQGQWPRQAQGQSEFQRQRQRVGVVEVASLKLQEPLKLFHGAPWDFLVVGLLV
eukprot:jgi/Ulvmu1/8605/UM046_0003.1